MTDAEYEATKARIQAALDKWVDTLGLKWWMITYNWSRDSLPDAPSKEGWIGVAKVQVQWPYMTAQISFGVCDFQDDSDETIEFHVLHELMHIFLAEMKTPGKDASNHEERVATQLARAFQWTWEAARQSPEP